MEVSLHVDHDFYLQCMSLFSAPFERFGGMPLLVILGKTAVRHIDTNFDTAKLRLKRAYATAHNGPISPSRDLSDPLENEDNTHAKNTSMAKKNEIPQAYARCELAGLTEIRNECLRAAINFKNSSAINTTANAIRETKNLTSNINKANCTKT